MPKPPLNPPGTTLFPSYAGCASSSNVPAREIRPQPSSRFRSARYRRPMRLRPCARSRSHPHSLHRRSRSARLLITDAVINVLSILAAMCDFVRSAIDFANTLGITVPRGRYPLRFGNGDATDHCHARCRETVESCGSTRTAPTAHRLRQWATIRETSYGRTVASSLLFLYEFYVLWRCA